MNLVYFTCKTNRSSKLIEEIGTLNFVLLQQSPIIASNRFCMGISDYFLRTKPLFNSFFRLLPLSHVSNLRRSPEKNAELGANTEFHLTAEIYTL
jgi:hypothetical protein